MKKGRLPKIKKHVKTFLLSEEGRISQKSLLKIGLGLIAISRLFASTDVEAAKHGNTWSTIKQSSTGSYHTSHASHGSHNSHSSHATHSAW